MKALTLKHPWPYCICRLGKDVENRTWAPGRRLAVGDWFAIHGGVPPRGAAFDEYMDDLAGIFDVFPRENLVAETIMPGIVAVCRFGGTVTNWCSSRWFNGPVGWVLAETVVLPEPVACKGAQGLWDLPEEVLSKTRRQYLMARKSGEGAQF